MGNHQLVLTLLTYTHSTAITALNTPTLTPLVFLFMSKVPYGIFSVNVQVRVG